MNSEPVVGDRAKLLLVMLIFSVWGLFAYQELTPVAGFIQSLREALLALGVFTATQSLPTKN